ncbi:hypothetical protein LOZ52_006642 [Ophidiomyces ophidiicola]|nr:hypothetical protein LOZ49_006730 [Ophidiomyces ophidiicola]KAI2127675.1 hypothetical protein LOZ29_006633 [Ophidiomyces ophidiicola]KAI2129506.1 hypothetical protein LOZ28_006639 [Ophidiomyces ophidiicola]KAI2207380.1 hypothetical protein LOZ15_006811 [Ophidiomyces ophidiicola]KAI2420708.1 hypothetical protein LOZ52_006642 [Ophidiomyces ophidiicola]
MSAPPHHDTSSLSDTESFESDEVLPSHDVLISTGGSSNLLVSNSYDTTHHSLDYLASLTRHPAPDNGINPSLLPESNIQSNTEDDNLFCEDSAIYSADTGQDQLLADYLANDVPDILDHDAASASPDADKQHRPGVEQADTYTRSVNMEQAADIQPTTSSSN